MMIDFERMDSMEVDDAGTLPDAVRASVRRRQWSRRVKVTGGALVTSALCVGIAVSLMQAPSHPGSGLASPKHRSALMMNDPIFEGLDGTESQDLDTTDWRADRFFRGDWSLEM